MPDHINLNVYKNENDAIKIRINILDFIERTKNSESIQDYMLKIFNYGIPNTAKQEIDRLNPPAKLIFNERIIENGKSTDLPMPQSYSLTIYQLPKDPYLALDLLAAFHFYIQNLKYDSVTFEQVLHQESLIGVERNIILNKQISSVSALSKFKLYDLLKDNKLKETESPVKKLAEAIIALGDVPGYEAVRNSIQKIIDWHNKNLDKDFHIGLMEERVNILEEGLSSDPANPNNLAPMFQLISNLIAKGEKSKLNAIIHHQNVMAKRKLYAACIGQKAAIGDNYSWHHTEWALLEAAQFCLRSDGKISIKMQGNSGYENAYSAEKSNHAILELEMKHLAKVLGLEFDENTNFHDEIIFSKESSKKLMSQGLHLNVDYFKKILKIRNTQIPHGIFSNENTSYQFSQIAQDVQKAILGLAYPQINEKEIMDNPRVGGLLKK